jgi:hypothetical protein
MYRRIGTFHAVTHLSFDVFLTVRLCQYNRYFKLLLIDDEVSGYFQLLHSFSCPVDICIAPKERYETIQGRMSECLRYETIQGRILECLRM